MTIVTYTAGWAALGFGVRLYQLGLQRRNLFENLGGHLISTALFGGAGYYFYGVKQRQEELLAQRRADLKQMREAQKARAALLKEGQDGSDE